MHFSLFISGTLLLALLSGCSSQGGGQGIILLNPGVDSPSGFQPTEQDSSGNDGVTISPIDLPSAGAGGVPQGSIPAPALRSNRLLAYSPDSASDNEVFDVVAGQPGSVGAQFIAPNNNQDIEGALSNAGPNPVVENTRVAISTNPLPEPQIQSPDGQLTAPVSLLTTPSVGANLVFAQNAWAHLKRAITRIAPTIKSAHAQEIVLPPLGPGSPGVEGLCARPDVTCCPVNPDGSFECAHPLTDASVQQLYIATISPEGGIGPAITEPVQSNLHYLATPAQTLTATQDEIFSLNQNRVVSLGREVDGRFRVRGDFNNQYRAYDANDVQSISYDSTNNLLTLKKQNTVDVANLSTTLRNAFGIREIAGTSTVNLNAGEQTTEMKLANGLVSYGIRNETPRNEGFIQRIRGLNLPPEPLQFFWQDLTRTTWFHRETVTFDIDSENYVVAVYVDDANNVRLRVGNLGLVPSPDRYSDIQLNGVDVTSLRNLQIYRNNIFDRVTRSIQNGLALILDTNNNRVGTVTFNHWGTTFSVQLDRWLSLGENKNPQSLVLNTTRTRAYILNRGDATVAVLGLDTPDGFPEILETINLQQIALPNKDIPLVPNSMAYLPSNGGNAQLVIGLENLRGSIVINAP